jgi:Holliday junction resolvase
MTAMTPEGRVKRVVTKQLRDMGAYYFYPVTGGYGRSGQPDIVGCYKGRFFGIECKANGNKPTPLQAQNIAEINKTGGVAFVANEDNMKEVSRILMEAVPNGIE